MEFTHKDSSAQVTNMYHIIQLVRSCTVYTGLAQVRLNESKGNKKHAPITFSYSSNLTVYRTARNFGEVFNLVNWRVYGKSPNLKPPNIAILRSVYAIGIGRHQI